MRKLNQEKSVWVGSETQESLGCRSRAKGLWAKDGVNGAEGKGI